MKTIYIAGPITGFEDTATARFEKAEKAIKDLGFKAMNPMKFPHNHDKTWKAYMQECLPKLSNCDGILLLRDYHKSKGAMLELTVARAYDLTEYYESGIPQH